MIRWRVVVPAALLLAASMLGVQWWMGRPTIVVDPRLGRSVPTFALPPANVRSPGLSSVDLARGGPVVVNFFASWCPPCRVEAPLLRGLAERGATVHGIAVRDAPGDASAFVARHRIAFGRVGLDRDGRVLRAFDATGLPETYVIDGRGVIAMRIVGQLQPDDIDRIERRLKRP